MIECRTLGPVEVTVNDQDPPSQLLWRKNLALLIYLARSPSGTRTRDHLTGLLWGDKPDSAARHSLREAVRAIRQSVGEDRLTTDHDRVRLAADTVRLDVDTLDALEQQGDWEVAAELFRGEFMDGFAVPDASEFEDWLAAERLRWNRRGAVALGRCAETQLARGQIRPALEAALRALDLEPTSEKALRMTLRALALAGDRAAALRRYEEFTQHLESVGARPDDETSELAERVRRERQWRLSGSVPTPETTGAELRRAPLVGRDSELEQLVSAWSACRHGQATVCVIEGDAGMGKTRLVEELVARARLDGATIVSVRAVEADLGNPWSGALGLARGELLDAPGLSAAAPDALGAFAEHLSAWAERFRSDREKVKPLATATTEIFQVVADEGPLVIVVDDAHWLDRDSLLALAATVRDLSAAPIILVFTIEPARQRSELDELRSHIGRDIAGLTVHLSPLDDGAVTALARWAVPTYDDDEIDRLAHRISVDSAGLPLLAVELLHAVALGLDLGTIDGAWPEPLRTLDHTLPGDLPDAVVAAIRVGFRRLSKDAQLVLATAAVLGERVDEERIRRASGLESGALHVALDELEWQRWLIAEPRGYAFLARIVEQAVGRDMVTKGQRQRIEAALN